MFHYILAKLIQLLMRTAITLLGILLISNVLFAQKNPIPREVRKSPELLSQYLTKNATTDRMKLDSLYGWVINNIDYDYDVIQSTQPLEGESAKDVLKKKETVCSGYVELLIEMLAYQNIRAVRIEGYTRDYDPDYPYILISSEHAWLAVELNGEWKLADPTWDAGYIGQIPKKVKTYPKRWERERTFDKEAKKQKWERKIRNKKAAFDDKLKEQDPYTDKIGFVRDTSLRNYLVPADTFLLTHLPEIPEWQLREHTISMDQFCHTKDSVALALSAPEGDRLDYKAMINSYMAKNIIERWLHNADQGFEFNPYNHGVKAINYYNSVGIFLDTDLKKKISKYPDLATRPIWEELIDRSDTTIVHAKLALKQVKELYKMDNNYYKVSFKQESKSQKSIEKETERLNKALEKLDETISVVNDKTEKELEYLAPRLSKYQIYRDRFELSQLPERESTSKEMQAILSSFDSLCAQTDSIITSLNSFQDNSSLQSVMDHLMEADYRNRYANACVAAFSIMLASNIAEQDSLAVQQLQLAQTVLEDSVSNELVPKELMGSVKEMERFIKLKLKEMEVLVENRKASNLTDYNRMFWAQFHERAEKTQEVLQNSLRHHAYIEQNLSVLNSGVGFVEESAKTLEKTREKRDEHLYKELETSVERGKNMFTTIQTDATAWKKEMKKRLKEK